MAVQCSKEIAETAAMRMLQAFTVLPSFLTVLQTLLQDQATQIAAIREELRAMQSGVSAATKKPAGYVDPTILGAKKFVSVKEAAFLLNVSEKTVRRLIEREILRTSNGLRVKRIPIEDIHAYMKRTE